MRCVTIIAHHTHLATAIIQCVIRRFFEQSNYNKHLYTIALLDTSPTGLLFLVFCHVSFCVINIKFENKTATGLSLLQKLTILFERVWIISN
jgi:hypothetical protein